MKKTVTILCAALVLGLGLQEAKALRYVTKQGTERAGTAGAVGVKDENFGRTHLTTLYLSSLSLGSFVNGNSANGVLLYTLPTGSELIDIGRVNIALTHDNGDAVNDTPDVGLGTTLASGTSAAVLSGVGAATENVLTGQTAIDANGTTFNGTAANVGLVRSTSDTKTIYLNAADAWDGNGSVSATGEVQIQWVDLIE